MTWTTAPQVCAWFRAITRKNSIRIDLLPTRSGPYGCGVTPLATSFREPRIDRCRDRCLINDSGERTHHGSHIRRSQHSDHRTDFHDFCDTLKSAGNPRKILGATGMNAMRASWGSAHFDGHAVILDGVLNIAWMRQLTSCT
jgi:hypothetical protein